MKPESVYATVASHVLNPTSILDVSVYQASGRIGPMGGFGECIRIVKLARCVARLQDLTALHLFETVFLSSSSFSVLFSRPVPARSVPLFIQFYPLLAFSGFRSEPCRERQPATDRPPARDSVCSLRSPSTGRYEEELTPSLDSGRDATNRRPVT